MYRHKQSLVITLTILLLFVVPVAAYAAGLQSETIKISRPAVNGLEVDGVLTVSGQATVNKVWLAVQGPGGEVEVVPLDVTNGRFEVQVWLRFGAGRYTIWGGDNATRFDGRIRFQVSNRLKDDLLYTTPSGYIDSDDPSIIALAATLTEDLETELEKARAIHHWMTANIKYDFAAYLQGQSEIRKASVVLERGEGICLDYAFLTAALARAAGLSARVVYGQASAGRGWDDQLHAWNEILVDGSWLTLDTTWDSGYIRNGRFVAAPRQRFFNPRAAELAKTHKVDSYTLY